MSTRFLLSVMVLTARLVLSGSPDVKTPHEEGTFRISINGKEIGTEKYEISSAVNSASSNSVLDFRNPSQASQKVHLETRLEMDGNYVPRSYQLKSDVAGKKGFLQGEFTPNQAMFQYSTEGNPRKEGVLVGKQYTVLDTNVFHHFCFLARLFDYNIKDKPQQFEVVIPQETDSGTLKIRDLGVETIDVRGKKVEAHHLQADSGLLSIDIWSDNDQVVRRIAVPGKGIEVVRNP